MRFNLFSPRRSLRLAVILAVAACVWSSTAIFAQDGPRPDLMREKANDIERKAADLKADGRHDEAKKLMMEVEELRNNADRMQGDRQGDRQQGEPMRPQPGMGGGPDNRREGQPMRQQPGMGSGPDNRPETPEFRQRMRHLQVAIDNLHAAGMHEPANRLAMDKERMMQEMRERSQHQGPRDNQDGQMQRRDGPDPLQQELQKLRNEVMELRKALKEVNGRVDGLKKEIKR